MILAGRKVLSKSATHFCRQDSRANQCWRLSFLYIMYMPLQDVTREIEIRNVGPINNVRLKINKVNLFIGPQGSGKSTIAKVISFCFWLEKNVLLHQTVSHVTLSFVVTNLLVFHKLEHYFSFNSVIKYTSGVVSFEYSQGIATIKEGPLFDRASVGKTAYIPSERNIVTIPEVSTIPFPNNCLRNYIFEWFNIRNKYNQKNNAKIADLDVSYYFDKESKKDILVLGNGKEIELHESSSGMQSAVPLYILLDYLTKWIYENTEDISFEKKDLILSALSNQFKKKTTENVSSELNQNHISASLDNRTQDIKKVMERLIAIAPTVKKTDYNDPKLNEYFSLNERLTGSHCSNIIIEEPELNLFPKTQTTLVYDILKFIKKNRDNVVITTHSPYILYALNNCMQAWLTNKENSETLDDLQEALAFTKESFIDPEIVSVWELGKGSFKNYSNTANGTIQDSNGLIRKNYFDAVMQNVMADFSTLSSLY